MKITLEMLYPSEIGTQPIVNPSIDFEVTPDFREQVANWLPTIMEKGLITKIGGY
jgi:hypothetical protein